MVEPFGCRDAGALVRSIGRARLRRSEAPANARPRPASTKVRGLFAIGLGLAVLVGTAGCEGSASGLASRILERYRKASGAKPLTAGGMIRIRLSPAQARTGAPGLAEILWEPGRYRESVSSAGMTTYRGIESGKAYFTDEDGVTRVVSDPSLRELNTRSYFWRRAWLFQNREGAWLRLGPADDATVAVSLKPQGGNPLLLSFSRRDGRLLSARSPRFHLDFSSATSMRDVSNPGMPVAGEIAWVGLPTGHIPQPYAGGGRARFAAPSAEVDFEKSGAVVVPARLSGAAIRLAIDAAADGPVRVSPELALRLPLAFTSDVFGREIAAGATLETGAVSYPSLFVQKSDTVPGGADAAAGACFFREAIVELDPEGRRFGLHDPERWVAPEGYFRIAIDDDEDRPAALLYRGNRELRVTLGSDTGASALVLAAESAERLGLAQAEGAKGLTWGAVRLPALPMRTSREGFFPEWGNDGTLGFPLLLRFHSYVNMPQRWIYVKPIER